MRAKSAVIIKVASNFLRLCGRAAGSRCVQVARACRHLRTEAERRACAASGDGATYFTHGVVQNLSRVYTFYLADAAGRTGRPGWAPWLCGGCRDPELAASCRLSS